MKKNILVIGGSYFAGRVFCIHASKGDQLSLHVVNRGRYKLHLPNVSEYQCDRHDTDKLSQILPNIKFDAVIDFCGYRPGEIIAIADALQDRIGQYIFISTSSVYTTTGIKKEGDATLTAPSNEAEQIEEYLFNKVRLEEELKERCGKTGIAFTIVRPCFIYGPYNYAPRESFFIEKIVKGLPVPAPSDARAKFNMVYVLDVARALETLVGDNKAFNEIFNLAGVEQVTYATLLSELKRCNGKPFSETPLTVSQVKAGNLPLPFPLDTDDLCSGEKMTESFGFTYTPFTNGMEKTFAAFKSVYS